MITLILIVVFASLFGYFATINTTSVVLHFLKYSSRPIPIYLVILASIGIGVLITMIFNFLKWFSTNMKLGRKEKDLKKANDELNNLNKTVHKLELENTKLEAELGKEDVDEDSI